MKPKTWITALLLLFVFSSVAFMLFQKSTSPADSTSGEISAPKPSDRVVAYYFHGNVRCATCRKLEAYAREALEAGFPQALADGRLEWLPINIDKPENRHFISDYQLRFRSLVLADMQNGRQNRWKNLQNIWKLANNKDAYIVYVQDEMREYLGE